MGIYAARTSHDTLDLLLIDARPARSSQVEIIRQAAKLHDFHAIHDFSQPLGEAASTAPGLVKRLTRAYKTRPFFKQIYQALYKVKKQRTQAQLLEDILDCIPELQQNFEALEIHSQPELHLLTPLRQHFPTASVAFYEHGLGDYLDLRKWYKEGDLFRPVFDQAFSRFLSHQNLPNEFVQPLIPPHEFADIGKRFLEVFRLDAGWQAPLAADTRLALFLFQPLERFNIPTDFWLYFIDLALSKVPSPESLHFLIKPHPLQSPEVISHVKAHFQQRNLSASILDLPDFRNVNIELLFGAMADQTDFVFTPFSSAIYYLAKFFPAPHIYYGYSLKSLSGFDQDLPSYIQERWTDVQAMIEMGFSDNTHDLGK